MFVPEILRRVVREEKFYLLKAADKNTTKTLFPVLKWPLIDEAVEAKYLRGLRAEF